MNEKCKKPGSPKISGEPFCYIKMLAIWYTMQERISALQM